MPTPQKQERSADFDICSELISEKLLSSLLDDVDVFYDGQNAFVLCHIDPHLIKALEVWAPISEDMEPDHDGEDDGEIDDEERAIEAAGNSTVSRGVPECEKEYSVWEFYSRHKSKEEQAYWHGHASFHIDPHLPNPFTLKDDRCLHIQWNQGKSKACDSVWSGFTKDISR